MESGGNLLPGGAMLLDSIFVLSPGIDGRQPLRRSQAPERLRRDLQDVPDQRRRRLTRLSRFPAVVRSRTAAKGDSTTFVVRRCCQCSRGN